MKYCEENLTVLVPVFNTSPKCFMDHYNSIRMFPDIKKIYWDDGITCEVTQHILYDLISKLPNVSIFKNQENRGQEYTVHCLSHSNEINTDYIIRVDADDTLNCLPEAEEDFDILLLGKASKNLLWLLSKGGSLNGSIFKTEIFKDVSSDHDKIKKYSEWIHEDIWYALNLFVPIYSGENKYKIVENIGGKRVTTRGLHQLQITNKKVTSRKLKRFDTFLLWTVEKRCFDVYYKATSEVNGFDTHMTMRRKKFKTN